MLDLTTEQFYNANADFKAYIDKQSATRHIPVNILLTYKMAKYVMDYIIERDKDAITEN